MVARFASGADELSSAIRPPFDIGPDSLFVAYYASAELGCFRALGWPTPVRILDLFAEFRCATNGLPTPCGNGLLGALAYFGIDSIDAADKETMRDLALRGAPYTDTERTALLDYCESDVVALGRLLRAMLPRIDLPRALLRGRYMAAAAAMEHKGVPIDVGLLKQLRDCWDEIKARMVVEVDRDYGVFVPSGRTADAASPLSFSSGKFARWLIDNNIPWPRLPTGNLALDDDTFRSMAKLHPVIAPLRELRHTLGRATPFRPGRGTRRPQSVFAVRLPFHHRSQPTQQRSVHFWSQLLAARTDQARNRAGP